MAAQNLEGRRLLIVEDEYWLAEDLACELRNIGADIIGPVGTLAEALSLIEETSTVDAAALDLNLRGEMVYPAADELVRRNIPVVFTTGYDTSAIPARFSKIARCRKPVETGEIVQALMDAMQSKD